MEATRRQGTGHNYLIQHSAGSGKTNSIRWLAHRLSTLTNGTGEKVYDSVIVISDRTNIDDQLRDAVDHDETVGALSPASTSTRSSLLRPCGTGG